MKDYLDPTLAPAEAEGLTPAAEAPAAPKKAPRLDPGAWTAGQDPASRPDPAEAPAADAAERVTVCDVQFRSGSKIYYFDPGQVPVRTGDHLIIDTARGAEYGFCVAGPHRVTQRELIQPLRKVLRLATAIDERIKADNERLEKEAYAFCQRKVEELGLDMQLVSAECAFDGSKLLFYFTADARVDFRELVKILAANYHTRIELRQIGVRDKAKLLGGLGICGRPFCCASFLDEFQPVSIKMAKTQNLSLNPTKISGTCGRLMCCLKYEQEAYEDLIQASPKADSLVDTPDGRGTVTAVNLMRQSVNVRMENDPEEIHCYKNCDICVLRSGKPRKNDPPIPDDLAPISGRKDEDLFHERRYLLDQRLVAEPEEEPEEEPEPAAEEPEAPVRDREKQPEAGNAGRSGRPRRDRRQKQGEQSKPEQPAREEAAPAEKPAPERAAEAGRKKRNRRPDRRGGQPEKPARLDAAERTEKPEAGEKQPSRQQRRRQQHGKAEFKLPQAEQGRHPAPEKRSEEQPVPKPEAKKNSKRRYYHNRKPKG